MNAHPAPRLRMSIQSLVVVAVSSLLFALQPTSAFASGGLSSVILTNALPGFVQVSAGVDNGPMNQSSINSIFASDTAAQRATIEQMFAIGLSGYVRVWHSEPLTGDGLVEFAFQSESQSSLSFLLGGLQRSASVQVAANHGSTFAVPLVADALGYKVHLANNSPPLDEYVVAFAKGNYAFLLTLVSTKYDLTEADVISLAQRQAAVTPGAAIGPQTLPSVGEDLLWGALVAILVALGATLWRRQRTRRLVSDNPAVDVTRYAVYKHLEKDQRKTVRKALVKSRVLDEDHLNNAAVAWANHNLALYWTYLASFVAFDATALIVSKGHVYVFSLVAIAMLIGALRLRRSRSRFMENRAERAVPVGVAPGLQPSPPVDASD